MQILKNIGALFLRLWRWIRETAWVQPLLIVGCIFGVIFSIPKFTSWFNALGVGSYSSYYIGKKVSLQGEVTGTTLDSKADFLTDAINSWSNFNNKYEEGEYDQFRAELNKTDVIQTYGEKFFVVYVKVDCANCSAIEPGFATLESNWGTKFKNDDGRAFRMYTIYTDEVSSNDDIYDIEDEKVAFNRYLDKFSDNGFFENAGGRLQDAPYAINAGISESSDYTNFIEASHTAFAVPAVMLVDFSKEAFDLERSRPGISEILFGVSGDDEIQKAELLMQMWNHTSKDDITNKFSDYYKKAA